MTPWWLRPFGAENQDDEETSNPSASLPPSSPPPAADSGAAADSRREAASEPPSEAAAPAEAAANGETADDAPASRSRSRRRRGTRGRGRASSAAAGASEEAEEETDGDDAEAEVEAAAPAPPAERERVAEPSRKSEPPRAASRPEPTRSEAPRGEAARSESGRLEAPRTERPRRSRFRFDDEADNGPAYTREVVVSVAPERAHSYNDERKIAMFCDLENIALGVRDSPEVKKFDITLVLERLLEKGKIIVKKAYCDWERYSDFKRAFHEAAIELIDIPQKYYSGKNSADIKMVVDAMDLCYSKEHLDTFVIMSGDSDFSPLVSKLKENNKYVIGVGVKGASSNLLIGNCDEFIYYEDVWRDQQKVPQLAGLNKKQAEVFELMVESILALVRENKDVLWGSMIKQTMQRKKPSFNEGYYGYSTFSELLEDAEAKSVIRLKKDQRSGSYIVTGFAQ